MSDQPATPPGMDMMAQMMAANPPKSAQDMRNMLDGFAGFMNADLPEVGPVHDEVLIREVDGTRVTADVIAPKGDGPHPVLVYLHGGGWVCGSPKTHRKLCFRFAEAGYLVVNVDYRLAPEAPFPAPFDDCVEAIRWAARNAEQYGGDPSRLAVGGDSAGGNLSAAAAVALADDPDAPEISAALLIYGVFDFDAMGQLAAEGDAGGDGGDPLQAIGEQMTDLMAGSYLGADWRTSDLSDARISPIHAADKLPPSHVVVGSADPLIAQAEALVEKLSATGVEHEHIVVPDMPHGYAQMEFFPQARESIDRMVSFLRKHLGA